MVSDRFLIQFILDGFMVSFFLRVILGGWSKDSCHVTFRKSLPFQKKANNKNIPFEAGDHAS